MGTSYTYAQLHAYAVTALSNGSSYQYDANGNMTCRVENSVTFAQVYNAENRLATIKKVLEGTCGSITKVDTQWDFAYDGDGTRVKQVVSTYDHETQSITGVSVTSYFMGGLYQVTDMGTGASCAGVGDAGLPSRTDGTSVFAARPVMPARPKVTKYYSIAGMMVAMSDSSGMKYLLTDHLGSVVATTDASGNMLSQQRYLPFGQVRTDVGSVTQTDFGYTGQRNISDIGLMDYKARFYDAAIGKFIQPDTIIPSTADPQTWNRYSYVYNNPIDLTDPTGNFGHCKGESGYRCKETQKKVRALETKWAAEAAAKAAADAAARQAENNRQSALSSLTGGGNDQSDSVPTTVGTYDSGYQVPSIPLDPTQNPNYVAFTPTNSTFSPHQREWIDCALSVVSVIASVFTLFPPPIFPVAVFVDASVTIASGTRTEVAYSEGNISNVRRWMLHATNGGGLIPEGPGIGFSVINLLITGFGYPP